MLTHKYTQILYIIVNCKLNSSMQKKNLITDTVCLHVIDHTLHLLQKYM